MLWIALQLALAPPAPACVAPTSAGIGYDGDGRALLSAALERACFVEAASAALRVTASLRVSEDGYALALEAKDAAGKLLARVTREAAAPGAGQPREDVLARAAQDAAGALRTRLGLGPPARACVALHDIVVLWHKDTRSEHRDVAVRALAARCVAVKEQVDGSRRMASDMAAMLELPLLALKILVDDSGVVSVTPDVVDATADELVVKAHASEKGRDADAAIRRALDAVLPAL